MRKRSNQREEELAKKKKIGAAPIDENTRIRLDDHDNDNSDESTSSLSYVCIYCGSPCDALYRQLTTSLSSIKAMHCEHCQRIVDPYIEREWLLVVIDCILLRPEAYRHILYNNQHWSYNSKTKEPYNDKNKESLTRTTPRVQRLVQWTVVSSLFHAYLKWQILVHNQQPMIHQDQQGVGYENHDDSSTLLCAVYTITSVMDLVAQWLVVYGYITFVSRISYESPSKDSNRNNGKLSTTADAVSASFSSHSIAYQIYVALLLPTSFRVVSVLVLIWENSKTTMALGSLLVAYWQSLGLSLISIPRRDTVSSRFLTSLTPLFGILSLIAWRFTVGYLLQVVSEENPYIFGFDQYHERIPCVGVELDIWGDIVPLFAPGELQTSHGGLSPSRICLA